MAYQAGHLYLRLALLSLAVDAIWEHQYLLHAIILYVWTYAALCLNAMLMLGLWVLAWALKVYCYYKLECLRWAEKSEKLHCLPAPLCPLCHSYCCYYYCTMHRVLWLGSGDPVNKLVLLHLQNTMHCVVVCALWQMERAEGVGEWCNFQTNNRGC